MNRMITTALLAFTLMSVADSGFAGEQTKPLIGVVHIQKIFDEYRFAKEMEDSIKEDATLAQKEIGAIKQQMKDKFNELTSDPLIKKGGTQWMLGMNEIKRMEIVVKDKELKFNRNFTARRAEFYRIIYSHFRKSVDIYAKYHKYDLIITAPNPDLTPPPDAEEPTKVDSPGAIQNEILLRNVQFVSATTDVTGPILQLMNQRYDKWKENGRQGSLD